VRIHNSLKVRFGHPVHLRTEKHAGSLVDIGYMISFHSQTDLSDGSLPIGSR
jgi:hypothetical protein